MLVGRKELSDAPHSECVSPLDRGHIEGMRQLSGEDLLPLFTRTGGIGPSDEWFARVSGP